MELNLSMPTHIIEKERVSHSLYCLSPFISEIMVFLFLSGVGKSVNVVLCLFFLLFGDADFFYAFVLFTIYGVKFIDICIRITQILR